jgi:hypothetical protein
MPIESAEIPEIDMDLVDPGLIALNPRLVLYFGRERSAPRFGRRDEFNGVANQVGSDSVDAEEGLPA